MKGAHPESTTAPELQKKRKLGKRGPENTVKEQWNGGHKISLCGRVD